MTVARLFLIILIFEMANCKINYYRRENEIVQPCARNTGEGEIVRNLETLHIGVVYPFESHTVDYSDWILNGIFYQIQRPIQIHFDPAEVKNWRIPNSILITFSSLNWYFTQEGVDKLNISVIHLGNLKCEEQNINFYSKAKYVFRNHYCINAFKKENVYFLPLGWLQAPDPFALESKISLNAKTYDASFIGNQFTQDRKLLGNFIELANEDNKYSILYELKLPSTRNKFFYTERLEYNGVMVDSKAVLVPGNNNNMLPPGNETTRFYEAVGNGVIPLTYEGEFLKVLFGNQDNIIVPVVKNWRRQLPKVFSNLKDTNWVDSTGDQIKTWWKGYHKELIEVIRSKFDILFNDVQLNCELDSL